MPDTYLSINPKQTLGKKKSSGLHFCLFSSESENSLENISCLHAMLQVGRALADVPNTNGSLTNLSY